MKNPAKTGQQEENWEDLLRRTDTLHKWRANENL